MQRPYMYRYLSTHALVPRAEPRPVLVSHSGRSPGREREAPARLARARPAAARTETR